jgi:hypothetical protein
MDVPRNLLDQPHLSVITRLADPELARIQSIIAHKALVDGRGDLEELFGALLAFDAPVMPKTLDLIGHATPDRSLLVLGDWVIDGTKATVTSYFRELADHDVMGRLGITAVRLIGCNTADTDTGRMTILTIAEILGLEVFGTTQLIFNAHYDANGFADDRAHCLIGSSALNAQQVCNQPLVNPWPQSLDIDSLPAESSREASGVWRHGFASAEQMREVLRLVKRSQGAQMPGMLAKPSAEVVFPSADPERYHRLQIMLDGEFVRVYPRGASEPGIVYPVQAPEMLQDLVARLPAL